MISPQTQQYIRDHRSAFGVDDRPSLDFSEADLRPIETKPGDPFGAKNGFWEVFCAHPRQMSEEEATPAHPHWHVILKRGRVTEEAPVEFYAGQCTQCGTVWVAESGEGAQGAP